MIALVIAALTCQGATPPAAAKAESLMTAGRAHFAGRIVGRYPALAAFREAARLCPSDPEPLYWQVKVGFYLGSDEGGRIAREAILRIFALQPDYADTWDRFRTLYQNRDIWRRADRALQAHPHDPVALERRAELAIALEQPERADSLLAQVSQHRPPDIAVFVLRAEASFLAERDTAGYRWYDSALALADADSTGVMWDRVWMIADPTEVERHEATPPGERRRFFERFWGKRDPNFVTAQNERIAEHFRRFAYVRRQFRLLHPLNLYHRSARYRAVLHSYQRDFLQQIAQAGAEPYPGAETDRLLAASRQLPDVRPGEGTASALAGVDARGLIYLRHGPPDQMLLGVFDPLNPMGPAQNALDVEGWVYRTPGRVLTIGFRRATAGAGDAAGDFVFLPTNRRQVVSTRIALRTDRTTIAAPLTARGWTAFFQSADLGLTDAYYKLLGDSAAASLWHASGALDPVRAKGSGSDVLRLSVPPGGYALGLDVDSAGRLGRVRRDVIVPRFSAVDLGLSSLALAHASKLLDREATLRGMPADLIYQSGRPLVSYVEIYGLTPDDSGRSHYRVRYTFAPARSFLGRLIGRGARPVVFEFDRAITGSSTSERLVIEPDKLPPGRYRTTLLVTDLTRNVKSESVALEIEIR